LFDFDGSLVNLDKLNVDAYALVFKEMFNLDFTRDDFMKYISGRGSREGIIEYLASKGITEFSSQELNDLFYKHKNELVNEKMNSEIYLLPGIKDFLESSIIKEKRKVIVTSSRKAHVKNILTHFGIYRDFEKVIDRFDVVKGKPSPEAYLKGLEYLDSAETECVAFEDSFFGLQSAKGAGIFTIGILNRGWNDDFVYQLLILLLMIYRVLL
jgi:HAD superfamily hydrolase (TIGR01509 family)